jgi:hypothetical protein
LAHEYPASDAFMMESKMSEPMNANSNEPTLGDDLLWSVAAIGFASTIPFQRSQFAGFAAV